MNKITLSDEIEANDERTNIINDSTPMKQRDVSFPLPKINSELDSKYESILQS